MTSTEIALLAIIMTLQSGVIGWIIRRILAHERWSSERSNKLSLEIQQLNQSLYGIEGTGQMGLVGKVDSIINKMERNSHLIEKICYKMNIEVAE